VPAHHVVPLEIFDEMLQRSLTELSIFTVVAVNVPERHDLSRSTLHISRRRSTEAWVVLGAALGLVVFLMLGVPAFLYAQIQSSKSRGSANGCNLLWRQSPGVRAGPR